MRFRIPWDNGKMDSHNALLFRVFRGPALCFGGFGLMRLNFWVGVVAVFGGLLSCGAEICFEPLLLKRPPWIQIGLFAVLALAAGSFLIGVVFPNHPIYVGYTSQTPT